MSEPDRKRTSSLLAIRIGLLLAILIGLVWLSAVEAQRAAIDIATKHDSPKGQVDLGWQVDSIRPYWYEGQVYWYVVVYNNNPGGERTFEDPDGVVYREPLSPGRWYGVSVDWKGTWRSFVGGG